MGERGIDRYLPGVADPNLIGEPDLCPGGEGVVPRTVVDPAREDYLSDVRGQLHLPLTVPHVDPQGNRTLFFRKYDLA